MFNFQNWIVKWSLRKGRSAIFGDCGLGKTLMQSEWGRQVVGFTRKPVLILAPLGVTQQTIEEGQKFNIEIEKYNHQTRNGIYISNYEQIDNIETEIFGGIVLDESGILKNFEGKTKNSIINYFSQTPYKLACSATPSPNDPMELGNHAEFLNVMSRNEMLAMFFTHDGGETSKWRIKGHAWKKFWQWVSRWAVMFQKPSDIGFSAIGYDLPELNLIERTIQTPARHNGMLFNETAISATNFNRELRITKIERLSEAAEIVKSSDENFIVWLKQNEEADLFKEMVPESIEVRGSERTEIKEMKLLGFAKNEFRILVTKTKIAQFGLNFQNCHNQIFASLDFSFEALYQAIRRSYRFGQTKPVNIYIITTDTMQNVINSIRRKEQQFKEMQAEMIEAMNEITSFTENTTEVINEYKDSDCHLIKGDCVEMIEKISDNSIGFSIFSPPFASLYTYSDKIADMGNSKTYDEFFFAFDLLVKQLHRVMWEGRNVAVHCMDLPIQKGREGYIGLRDFSGMIRESFERAGFIYHSKVTIWKDPVVEMQRTKALGLLHKQVKKDSAMSRVGLPDYLMVFRKRGENLHPIKCNIPVDVWQKYASPVWYDINYSKTLNGRAGRSENDEKHICPLQLETIERAIHLWSSEGDTVFTPFGGIGSEVYQALKMNRKAKGIELKDSYFDVMVKNALLAKEGIRQMSIFDIAA
jgi:DNA modification methylase